MDRTKTDTIIGIVGAVAIVFTLVGVFAYEYNNAPEDTDGGEDNMVENGPATDSNSGTVAASGSDTWEFEAGANAVSFTLSIDWTATAPGPVSDQAGSYTWQLQDPFGTIIAQSDSASSADVNDVAIDTVEPGTYTLTVSGRGGCSCSPLGYKLIDSQSPPVPG